jgi:RNA polymerase sigma-70 factor (ECF subfamily)
LRFALEPVFNCILGDSFIERWPLSKRIMPAIATTRELAPVPPTAAAAPGGLPDFDRLYDDYIDFVCRNTRRLGVAPSAVDDVVQDVFVVAHRRLPDVEKPESLRAWMLSIVIRVVRDHRRTIRRRGFVQRAADVQLELDQLADSRSAGQHASVEQVDALRVLHRLLAQLDDAKREVFVLAELEELTELEIAAALGEKVNTVHSRLRAARKIFELALQRQRTRDEWSLR